jgi:fatty acid desaturase
LLFWLILERIIDTVAQMRDRLTQLYACHNLDTYPWVGWPIGGLNYHTVHHAFLDIPCNRLSAAFDRIQELLQRNGLPRMLQGKSYLRETIE